MNINQSKQLYLEACEVIPGGVNSPVRAFRGVGGTPIFMKKAQGAYLWDVDDNRYIDYIGSWGPAILGHAHPKVISAIQEQVTQGLSFGAPSPLETELVKLIQQFIPSLEMLRLVSSGTEATLSAIRLARGYTNRKKILKFEGCYHGHSDSLLVKGGSGLLTCGVPTSAGVPEEFIAHTITAPFNDENALHSIFAKYGSELAAVIIEPIAGNMNLVLPKLSFLQLLRSLCDEHESLLIFDEVMTGFRVARGGAQALYHIEPDLTTLAKIIGGGLPVGAFGGKQAIMEHLAPLGGVYQAGTLSGNPVAMSSGITTLKIIAEQEDFYLRLSALTEDLVKGLTDIAQSQKIDFFAQAVGGMFGMYFLPPQEIHNYQDIAKSNLDLFKKFFHGMLEEGIYFAPSAFEAGFVSIAHTQADIQKTLLTAEKVMQSL